MILMLYSMPQINCNYSYKVPYNHTKLQPPPLFVSIYGGNKKQPKLYNKPLIFISTNLGNKKTIEYYHPSKIQVIHAYFYSIGGYCHDITPSYLKFTRAYKFNNQGCKVKFGPTIKPQRQQGAKPITGLAQTSIHSSTVSDKTEENLQQRSCLTCKVKLSY